MSKPTYEDIKLDYGYEKSIKDKLEDNYRKARKNNED